jgi:hypothetical protein
MYQKKERHKVMNEIVIKIQDRIYKMIQNKSLNIIDSEIVEEAIRNGVVLPKGHGKLKDVDAFVYLDEIEDAPTIINADTEREV